MTDRYDVAASLFQKLREQSDPAHTEALLEFLNENFAKPSIEKCRVFEHNDFDPVNPTILRTYNDTAVVVLTLRHMFNIPGAAFHIYDIPAFGLIVDKLKDAIFASTAPSAKVDPYVPPSLDLEAAEFSEKLVDLLTQYGGDLPRFFKIHGWVISNQSDGTISVKSPHGAFRLSIAREA